MNKEQLYAAQTAMIEWLSDPHELGKKPFKIECAGEFDFNEMHYYIFKFKESLLGKWLVGVCGGFEDDDLYRKAQGNIYIYAKNLVDKYREQAIKLHNK